MPPIIGICQDRERGEQTERFGGVCKNLGGCAKLLFLFVFTEVLRNTEVSMRSPSPPADVRALLHEQFDALLDECDQVADNAAYGQMIHDLDDLLFIKGREFIKKIYQQKLQEHIERTEAKTETQQCSQCKKKTKIINKKTKTIVSAHGHVTLHRRRFDCSPCEHSAFFVDIILGIDDGYTNKLKRLVARCSGFWSYRLAAENLEEFCAIQLSHTFIGKLADKTAGEMAAKLPDCSDIRNTFQKAKGEKEFQLDGTSVNTRNADGKAEWREMKVGAFAKRERGKSALPSEWESRKLPEPTVLSAFAAIECKEDFQERCQAERRRLGVGGVTSTLGDGAKWLWNVVRDVFGKTDECLDIYHASEHLASCGKILYGNGQVFLDWLDRMRFVLLSEGFPGVDRELCALEVVLKSGQEPSHCSAVKSLREYLLGHVGRLNYCERLSSGRSIGSGLIEGACKNLVGRRLKQTGACWNVSRANRIAVICATLYSNQWKQYWANTS
jgi:hypothetical protein